jgi:stage II sporulation protein D
MRSAFTRFESEPMLGRKRGAHSLQHSSHGGPEHVSPGRQSWVSRRTRASPVGATQALARAAVPVLLLLLGVSAEAQQRTVLVRLFWQHPPTEIHVTPEGASLRSCDNCAAAQLSGPAVITAKGSNVSAGAVSGTKLVLTGRVRISGDGFLAFPVENETRIEARDDFLLLTLSMPMEQYVTAVLQGESASFKSDEALKAMAVAARTYAVHFGSRHHLEGFDFCDTTHCQDLRLGNESARVRSAVAATQGELLWYEGRPAATYYHRSCGGELEDASALDPELHAPYLRHHHDDYCVRVPDEWQAQITKSDLARALGRPVTTVSVAARSASGRVQRLLVEGRSVSATDFRFAVGRTLGWDKLRSDLYQEQDLGDSIGFRGRGQGHGVGLCQAGAESMGEQGRSYREILAFYYPGTAVGINAQGISWEKLPGESLDLITTNREDAAVLLPAAERALGFAKERTGWDIGTRPQVKVFPTIAIYRDATGEPGWVAASTMGSVVRVQPISTLLRTHALDSTLRHEFLHMLIESQAGPKTPLWLREGLAIYLSNPESARPAKVDVDALERQPHSLRSEEEMRAAYRSCAAAVADAVEKNGLSAVLAWVSGKH